MQFEALQVFCDIARCRSFSQAAAAQQPPLSQSAVSQIVHQLEKRLGVQLINRATRPLQLTPLGQAYYQGCKQLVERYLELEASIKQGRPQLTATVQAAAIYSVGLGDMGQYVERFTAEQPFARVHVEYLHSNRVVEKVRDGSVDLGLVSFPRKSRDLVVLPWREEDMVLACQPEHPLARQTTVRLGQLSGEKYIAFDKDLGIRRQVDRFLRQQGVAVEVELEFDNIENIKKGIEIAGGVALLAGADAAAGSASGFAGGAAVGRLSFRSAVGHHLSAAASAQPGGPAFHRSACWRTAAPMPSTNSNGTVHDRKATRKKT